ncbi:MAG: hypothetical protein ABIN83_00995 [Sphingomicrobium sp.]
MSIAKFAIGEGAVSQGEPTVVRTKTPPKRTTIAFADIQAAPEPR